MEGKEGEEKVAVSGVEREVGLEVAMVEGLEVGRAGLAAGAQVGDWEEGWEEGWGEGWGAAMVGAVGEGMAVGWVEAMAGERVVARAAG